MLCLPTCVVQDQLTYYGSMESMNYPPNHDELLQAIEQNKLDRVKQLLDSGINLNSVLHSRSRREHATVLGTAAYEGRTDIVRYLLNLKVTVNYQDPCLSRNALHWAAIGGQFNAVKLLVDSGINVNSRDRDNVTPIIRAAMNGQKDIVKLLIQRGADVNLYDRLHSSALHYASFHGKSKVVIMLIQAGCIQNNPAIFGQGTPLANLVYHGDIKSCKLLVEAGYNLNNDTWILHYDFARQMDRDTHIAEYLLFQIRNPLTLMQTCRYAIRRAFCGTCVQENVKRLPLPPKLLSFMALENL